MKFHLVMEEEEEESLLVSRGLAPAPLLVPVALEYVSDKLLPKKIEKLLN